MHVSFYAQHEHATNYKTMFHQNVPLKRAVNIPQMLFQGSKTFGADSSNWHSSTKYLELSVRIILVSKTLSQKRRPLEKV